MTSKAYGTAFSNWAIPPARSPFRAICGRRPRPGADASLARKTQAAARGAALFFAWTDLAGTGESLLTNARHDAVFGAREIRIAADWYLNGAEPQTPEASPLYAPLDGLPPLFIEVGERESLLDDSTRLAARAEARGVNAILNVWPVVPHARQLACAFVPEGRRSLARAAAFLLRIERTNRRSFDSSQKRGICKSGKHNQIRRQSAIH